MGGPLTGAAMVAVAASIGTLVIAAEVDRRHARLPDGLLVAAVLPVLIVGLVASQLGAVALGAAYGAVPPAMLHLVSPRGLGFGDVKLAAVLGATLGLAEPRLALVGVCLAAGTASAVALVRRRRAVAFGPYLVSASALVLAMAMTSSLLVAEAMPWR